MWVWFPHRGVQCLRFPMPLSSSSLGNKMAKRNKKFVWTLEASLWFGVPLLSLFSAFLVFMERDFFYFFFIVEEAERGARLLKHSFLPLKYVFPVLSHFQA